MHKLGRVVFVTAVSLGALFLQPASAEACSCGVPLGYGDPVVDLRITESRYSRSFAVFAGRVTTSGNLQVILEVQRTWKGPAGPTVSIQVGSLEPDGYVSRSTCDPSFKVGETYLVYAFGDSSAELRSNSCGGTRLLQTAAQEVLNLDYVVKQAGGTAAGTHGPVTR